MYYEAHKEHGSLPWSRIVEPAIAWAESGWTVRPHVHYWWSDDGAFGRAPNHERTGFTPAARALYCRPDGTPKRVGDRVVNRDYGQTLRAIAKGGADVFYAGEIARAIAEDMRKNDALLSARGPRRRGSRCATRRCGATIAAIASRPTSRPAAASCCSRC